CSISWDARSGSCWTKAPSRRLERGRRSRRRRQRLGEHRFTRTAVAIGTGSRPRASWCFNRNGRMLKNLLHKLRRSPFDFPVSGGGTIGDIVCAPLDRAGLELAVIDLGARNGMYHVPASYARRSKLLGFEPNPKEYEKLTSCTTDMNKTGQVAPAFKRAEYHPFAVWRGRERRQLYITSATGGSTLMGESVP